MLAEAGDLQSALASLDELDEQYPGYPRLQYTRATVLEMGGRTSDAVAQFEKSLKERPQDPELLNALGFTMADHKLKLARAEELIRAALAASPDNPAIQDSLGWVLYQRGKKIAGIADSGARLAEQRRRGDCRALWRGAVEEW